MIYAHFKITLEEATTYYLFQAKDYNDLHKQLGKIQQQMLHKVHDLIEPHTKCKVESLPINFMEVIKI